MTIAPQTGRAAIMIPVAGHEYEQRYERRCKVCNSDFRHDVEKGLIGGRSYRNIIETLPEDANLSTDNVQRHFLNGHLGTEHSPTRQIAEERAVELGKSIENETASLIDGITLARTVVEKTFQRIAAGEIQPDLREGLVAVKLLAEFGEYDAGGTDMTAITEAFMVYHENAQAFMTPQQFEAFGQALNSSPVLAALASKYEEGHTETIKGETIEKQEESSDSQA